MVFDPKSVCAHLPVVIRRQTNEQVVLCRYVGIYLNNKLSWSVHVEAVCTLAQKHRYFLRRLRAFGVQS